MRREASGDRAKIRATAATKTTSERAYYTSDLRANQLYVNHSPLPLPLFLRPPSPPSQSLRQLYPNERGWSKRRAAIFHPCLQLCRSHQAEQVLRHRKATSLIVASLLTPPQSHPPHPRPFVRSRSQPPPRRSAALSFGSPLPCLLTTSTAAPKSHTRST